MKNKSKKSNKEKRKVSIRNRWGWVKIIKRAFTLLIWGAFMTSLRQAERINALWLTLHWLAPLLPISKRRKEPLNHSPSVHSTLLICQLISHRKLSLFRKTGLKVVLIISITTLLITTLNRDWKQCGSSSRIRSFKKKDEMKRLRTQWINGLRHVPVWKRRSSGRKNIKTSLRTLKKQGDSFERIGKVRILTRARILVS